MTAPAMVTATPLGRKQRLELLRAQLKSERSSFEGDWRECAQYISPRRARFVSSDRNKGGRQTNKIIDSTGTFAARTLSSGLMSGVSSPARPWFRLTTRDPQLAELGPVKTWLADATRILLTILSRSNAYNILGAGYDDLGIFGTSALAMLEDDEDVIRCEHFPVGSYYLATNYKGQVRTFVREFDWSVEQIVQRFGVTPGRRGINWAKLSSAVKTAYEAGNRLATMPIVFVVTENAQYDPSKLEARRKAFYSCYYEPGGEADTLLEESGFDEFPIFAPRWGVIGGDSYACEWPGSVALGDIKALQLGEKQLAKAVNKMVDPPLRASPNMRNERISLIGGDISYDASPDAQGVRPIHEVKPEVLQLHELQSMTRDRIQRAYFADLFLMLANGNDRDRTAREIDERHEEKLLAVGPVLERMNTDLFDPFVGRLFNIALRRGLLPPPPEELEGEDLPIEYISIMAQAQKMVSLAAVDHVLTRAERLAAMLPNNPDALDKLDVDQTLDEVADMTGVPPRMMRSDDAVDALRQSRAQAQQAAEQSAQLAEQAKAAQSLAAADTSGKNALTDLLSATAGPAAVGGGL